MNYDNPRIVIDRKQNLSELCSNVCQQHERFKNEIMRAGEHGIKVIFLVEHGPDITSLEDVIWWDNPRSQRRIQDAYGHWKTVHTKAISGDILYKILCTIQRKYGCEFLFCDKKDTGRRIVELLGGGADG